MVLVECVTVEVLVVDVKLRTMWLVDEVLVEVFLVKFHSSSGSVEVLVKVTRVLDSVVTVVVGKVRVWLLVVVDVSVAVCHA